MSTTAFLFYASIFIISYTYVGYPIMLMGIAIWRKQKVKRSSFYPKVTIIIPVFNEENQIQDKIDNCLEFEYPNSKMEILVASDASTDRTDEIVRQYKGRGVRSVRLAIRGGKVSAQNFAVQQVDAEIIVFTDVAILCRPEALRLITENFYDPEVGAVSCRDMVIGDENQGDGERGYIRYDMLVRHFTSKIGSMIGVTGGFFAMRAEIAHGGWNPAFPPDFYAALRTIKRGLRVIEDDRVKAYYKTASRAWDELPRKVRTINRGMSALFASSNRSLLNPFRYGFIAIQLFSHKVLRWLSPVFFLILFVSNALICLDSPFLFFAFIGQLCLYSIALAAFWGYKPKRLQSFFNLSHYFLMANIALVQAWAEFFIGKRYIKWQPTKR